MTAIPHRETFPAAHTFSGPTYQAYRVLQIAFVAVPIIAGIDKFFDVFVNWDQYLAPPIAGLLGTGDHIFMMLAGIVEIIAGIGIALKPRYFGYIVCAWLACIIINLLIAGGFFDIALRDLGLGLAAFALGQLAQVYDHGNFGGLMTRNAS